jgi:glycosyltransferase involved in cell wall biosynthesis
VPDALPSVSVIIACRPDQEVVLAAEAARRFDYPGDKLEIILARGRQPSAQRNTALRAARGDLVCFLDDDSMAPPDHLRRALPRFTDPQVQMVGGPNLCPPDAPELEQLFAIAHASWLAFGPSRARYTAVGSVRATGEKELILCNLLARRQPVLDLGGFDEKMYPNEENALMDELQKRGGQLIYDPALIVHRRPRKTVRAFARMLFNYGRGRAEQVRLHPTLASLPNFAPPLFLLYLVAVVFLVRWLPDEWSLVALAPLGLYALLVLGEAFNAARVFGLGRSLKAAPYVPFTHLVYGFGFGRGLFKKIRAPADRPPTEVKLEIVSV